MRVKDLVVPIGKSIFLVRDVQCCSHCHRHRVFRANACNVVFLSCYCILVVCFLSLRRQRTLRGTMSPIGVSMSSKAGDLAASVSCCSLFSTNGARASCSRVPSEVTSVTRDSIGVKASVLEIYIPSLRFNGVIYWSMSTSRFSCRESCKPPISPTQQHLIGYP